MMTRFSAMSLGGNHSGFAFLFEAFDFAPFRILGVLGSKAGASSMTVTSAISATSSSLVTSTVGIEGGEDEDADADADMATLERGSTSAAPFESMKASVTAGGFVTNCSTKCRRKTPQSQSLFCCGTRGEKEGMVLPSKTRLPWVAARVSSQASYRRHCNLMLGWRSTTNIQQSWAHGRKSFTCRYDRT